VVYWPRDGRILMAANTPKEEPAMSHLDQQARYAVTVAGSIDPTLAEWCGPLTITQEQMPGGALVTHLTDIVADQAGLVGMIRRLHGLGVVLLYIERCASSSDANA
jgi:hypothetical protein